MCVRIFPLSFDDRELIAALAETIKNRLNIEVELAEVKFTLDGGRDPVRNQINSNWVLAKLLEHSPNSTARLLGVTDRDLFSPVLTYVFGEAELGGRAAVVSTHRFRNEFYGLQANPDLVRERLIRETMHELGHTYGLFHCASYSCVMYPSSYAEEIDLKSSHFCTSCERKLRQAQDNLNPS